MCDVNDELCNNAVLVIKIFTKCEKCSCSTCLVTTYTGSGLEDDRHANKHFVGHNSNNLSNNKQVVSIVMSI